MDSEKGKEKVADGGGKRKRKSTGGGDDGKTGWKRKEPRGIQPFHEDAYDDFENDDSGILVFDGDDQKKSFDKFFYVKSLSSKDRKIWKVKCMEGRERSIAICLMRKFADMVRKGTELQILSACAIDHVRGFVFIEAEKKKDIYEACKGLSIYPSRMTEVPENELARLLWVKRKPILISKGMWARVKNGKYKGDLAQVVAVNDSLKEASVKLVPRTDLKAMAEKFARGGAFEGRRADIPAQSTETDQL